MVEGLIGKKIGMTQQFDDAGNVIPVTILKAGPCTVIQKKTVEKDGYVAVQLGFVEERGVRKPLKPQIGHFKRSGVPVVRKLQEVGCSDPAAVKEGDQVLVDIFEVDDSWQEPRPRKASIEEEDQTDDDMPVLVQERHEEGNEEEIEGFENKITCPVIAGTKGSMFLLGATALENFGVEADPVNKSLNPIMAIIGGFIASR